MTMPALYEISQEYLTALDVLTDPDNDVPLEAVTDTLEGIEGQLQEKAVNVAKFLRNLDAAAAAIKEAEQQMARRRRTIENRAHGLRSYLQHNMESTGITRIECPWFVLAIHRNPAAVEISDVEQIPEEFRQEVVSVKIDKTAIKDALKSGRTVTGATLASGTRLVIR